MGWVGGGGGTGTGGGSGRAGGRESAQVEMSELSWGDTKSPWARRRGGSDDIVDNRGAEAMVQEDEDQDNSLSAVNPMAAGRDRKSSVQFDNPLVKRGGGWSSMSVSTAPDSTVHACLAIAGHLYLAAAWQASDVEAEGPQHHLCNLIVGWQL